MVGVLVRRLRWTDGIQLFDVDARSLICLDRFELKFGVHLLHDLTTIE